MLLIWSGAAFLEILSIGRFYNHYMMALIPSLSLACGYWMEGLDRRSLLALAGGVLTMIYAIGALQFALNMAEDGAHPSKVRDSQAIAAYIRAHTQDSDRIFSYRFRNPDVFYLSGRLSNNGIYEYPDMCVANMKDPELARAKRAGFLSSPPAMIVMDPSISAYGCEDSDDFFTRVISEDYVRAAHFGSVEIHARRGKGPLNHPEGAARRD